MSEDLRRGEWALDLRVDPIIGGDSFVSLSNRYTNRLLVSGIGSKVGGVVRACIEDHLKELGI